MRKRDLHLILTQNILLRMDDGTYDLNKYGRYWAIVGTVTEQEENNTRISEIQRVRVESKPFTLDEPKMQERIDLFKEALLNKQDLPFAPITQVGESVILPI